MDDNMYRFYVNLIIIITTLVSSLIIGGSFFFYYYRRNRNTLPHGSSSSQILSNNETDITKISLNSVATNKSHKASKTVSINIGVSHSSDSSKLPDVPLAEYISETISDRKEDSVYTQNNIKKGSSNTNTKKLSPIAESYTLPKSNTESSEAGKGPNVPLNNTNTFTINSSDHSSNTRTSRPSFSSPSHTIPDTGNYLSIPGFLQIDPTSFLIGAKITSGGGGEIMKVVVVTDELRSRAPNQQLVAKVMTSGGIETFLQEVSIMAMFKSHPNFAKIVGFDEATMTILMICYPFGSLADWILISKPRKLYQIIHLLCGISNALNALHNSGIAHNDVKPANVLIDVIGENELCAKITDFGISNVISFTSLKVRSFTVHNRMGFSKHYAAPEKLLNTIPNLSSDDYAQYMTSADVYSLSIVTSEMMIRRK